MWMRRGTCEWVMSRMWMRHVSVASALGYTQVIGWVMSHMWMRRGTCEWVMSHVLVKCHCCQRVRIHRGTMMSHVTHVNEAWHEWKGMSHTNEPCRGGQRGRVHAGDRMSHVTHVNEAWHVWMRHVTCECVMLHTWINHVTCQKWKSAGADMNMGWLRLVGSLKL